MWLGFDVGLGRRGIVGGRSSCLDFKVVGLEAGLRICGFIVAWSVCGWPVRERVHMSSVDWFGFGLRVKTPTES